MKKVFVNHLILVVATSILLLSSTTNTVYASSGDPVYDSMTLPSESQSDYMKKSHRDVGKIIGDTSSPLSEKVLSIGAVYPTSGATLPDHFSVYLGKMKLFAYSASRGRWIVLDYQPYPAGIYIYTLPWETTKSSKCKNITYTQDYAKIDLTASDLSNSVLHFWGHCVDIDKSDYLYYACAYSFWVDEPAKGKLTATSGIDTKMRDGANGGEQLYYSRGLSTDTFEKVQWGHTVPIPLYYAYNTSSLNELFRTGQTEPDLFVNKYSDKEEYIDPKQIITSLSKIKAGNRSFRVYWKKITTKINGYQIQYSTDKRFKKTVYSRIINNRLTKSTTIKALKSKKVYYVRVRTYRQYGKFKVFSKWSKKKKVKVK